MNLEAAKKHAEGLAKVFLGAPKVPCPTPKTGLIVVVYRIDDGEALPSAEVKLSGKATKLVPPKNNRKRGIIKPYEIKGQARTTDEEGVARYLPLDPGTFSVSGDAKGPDACWVWGGAIEQHVVRGTCPICEIGVRVKARPEIVVTWKHDGAGLRDVTVKLGGAHTFKDKTDGNGLTSWTEDPIDPGPHAVTLTFGDASRYQIFAEDSDVPTDPAVDLPPGKSRSTFRVRRLSWLKFHVLRVKPGSSTEDLKGSKLVIKWPDGDAERTHEQDGAEKEIPDIPEVSGPSTKCEVVRLETPGDDEVFEFVELA